eukprot:TRINITY_DN1343_c0_g1_i2.p1 TRINITY_DN1343_c0_g1~~TRINITY_DN1343_c0_g1_i2.p1  ORF type:complete len:930 (-),score=365.62 TRINITY_DN1343_c0_g1_i2:259-3048(-)
MDVCLHCFNGGCPQLHGKQHALKFNHPLVANHTSYAVPEETNEDEPPKKLTKVAIGVEGGAPVEGANIETDITVFCRICDVLIDHTSSEIPNVGDIVSQIVAADSFEHNDAMNSWEQQIIGCVHTREMVQVENVAKLNDKELSHCSKCDLDRNFWICLICGNLGCGREQFGGDPGNNHAIMHHEETGHAVVVKVGTITPEGKADIYCYACDEPRLDDNLPAHLEHLGINVATQEKTEVSMSERELEQNMMIGSGPVEDGKAIEQMFGPGLTGLKNLGNTCYLNSSLQLFFKLPMFIERYNNNQFHHAVCRKEHYSCWECQMGKLAHGLLSGEFSSEQFVKEMAVRFDGKSIEELESSSKTPLQPGVPPRMWKALACGKHPDFKTVEQQDAMEFVQFFINTVAKNEAMSGFDPTVCTKFDAKERIECQKCHHVRYKTVKNISNMDLEVPLDESQIQGQLDSINAANDMKQQQKEMRALKLTRQKEREESGESTEALLTEEERKIMTAELPKQEALQVSMEDCFAATHADGYLDGYNCPVCNEPTTISKKIGFDSFPDVLITRAKKFYLNGWVPVKLNVEIETPDSIDLSPYAISPSDNEQRMPGDDEDEDAGPQWNEEALQQLVAMDLNENASKRALIACDNNPETAAMWVFEHMGDPGVNDPLPQPGASNNASAGPVWDEEALKQMLEMGLNENLCKRALIECDNNVDNATMWAFEHMGDPGVNDPLPTPGASNNTAAPLWDEGALQQLLAMDLNENASKRALIECDNNAEMATMWVFEHMGDPGVTDPLPEPDAAQEGPEVNPSALSILTGAGYSEIVATKALLVCNNDVEAAQKFVQAFPYDESPIPGGLEQAQPLDGNGEYDLLGFITHRGSSASSGHYVAHVKVGDDWVIYNDSDVARSETRVAQHGYIYFWVKKGIASSSSSSN